jgi:hypothetical protein
MGDSLNASGDRDASERGRSEFGASLRQRLARIFRWPEGPTFSNEEDATMVLFSCLRSEPDRPQDNP